jgi:sugar phosphate isomerase/epimerase
MHLSAHNWMRAEGLETTLRRMKRLGFSSIEISGEPAQYDVAETRRLLRKYGITCWGAVTLTLGDRNLAAADAAQRAATVAYMQRVVRLAHDLGGTETTVVPTTVGKVVPDASPEQEWRWVVEGLQEVYAFAERLGVRLALEPLNRFETYFLNRCDQALALAQDVGPNCGVCLDAFHINIEEADMFAAIRAAGSRLADFHVADNNRMAPGQGSLNWQRIVATLREAGYEGALTVEFVAPIDRTPVNPHPDQLETAPVDISPEQRKFIQDHGSNMLSEPFYTALMAKSAATLLPLIG